MKIFGKLFLIIFSFIISFCSADASLYITKSAPIDTLSSPAAIVCQHNSESENAIVCANHNNIEIELQKGENKTFGNGNITKTSSQYKFLQEIFTRNYNKTYISKFHKIFPYLKNEICTRAP